MPALSSCARCGAELRQQNAEGFCTRCLLENVLEDAIPEPTLSIEGIQTSSADTENLGSKHEDRDRRFFGEYELLEEIARGGMGIVFRARQTKLDRIVALKMMLAGQFASKEIIKRFRGEVTAAALLQHPNIVAIHDVGVHGDQHYFSMDYVEGQNLAQRVGSRPLPAAHAARYLRTIAEAIHYAHEQGILHRDLKPSNVLIDSATDQPRITDFGLAKRLNGESSLTVTGQVLGSPNFMPPEQAGSERHKVSRQSDVYGLGAILYYLLTARAPFQAESLEGIVTQVLQSDPIAPRSLNPGVPRDLETICLKCLCKAPAGRYSTAQELADELGRFLQHEPIEARPAGQLEKAWRWCRRKPAIASLSAATVLLLLAVAIGSPIALVRIQQAREQSEQAREQSEQMSYDSDMRLAQFAWDDKDLGLALDRLSAHLPAAGKRDRRGFEWFYFSNLCKGDQSRILTNHTQAVTSVVFSPDGQRFATGAVGDPVHVWETASGKLLWRLPELNVTSLAFTPDGSGLGVGGQDQVTIWNLKTGRPIFGHKQALGKFQIAFPPAGQRIFLGTNALYRRFGKDVGSVAIWDYVTDQLLDSLPTNSGGYLAIPVRGDQLVTGNSGDKTKIWDLETLQFIRPIDTGPLTAMAVSPDGKTLAAAADRVELWDIKTGTMRGRLTNYHERVWSLAFSPDGQLLATGGVDQSVRVWDVRTCQQVQNLRGHGSEVLAVAFSEDGETLVSGSKDHTVRLWNLHSTRLSTTISNANSNSRPIFSPNSQYIAATLTHGGVGIWETETLKLRAIYTNAFDAVAFSPDSKSVIARGTNFFLATFDIAANAVVQIAPGNSVAKQSFTALSPDRTILALGLANGTVSLYDAQNGVLLNETSAFAANIFRLVFSPDGTLLAVAGRDIDAGLPGGVKVWDVKPFKIRQWVVSHADIALGVDFMPDGKTLATGGNDNAIRFWDTATWKEVSPPLMHKEAVICLTISRDGKTMASISFYKGIKLWNPATGRELASFNESASYLTFSPDGQTLALSGNGIRLWRAPRPN
jgi:WD40 repeat protein/serine/threonine protein kinase